MIGLLRRLEKFLKRNQISYLHMLILECHISKKACMKMPCLNFKYPLCFPQEVLYTSLGLLMLAPWQAKEKKHIK